MFNGIFELLSNVGYILGLPKYVINKKSFLPSIIFKIKKDYLLDMTCERFGAIPEVYAEVVRILEATEFTDVHCSDSLTSTLVQPLSSNFNLEESISEYVEEEEDLSVKSLGDQPETYLQKLKKLPSQSYVEVKEFINAPKRLSLTLGRKSARITCPNCLTPIKTKLSHYSSKRTRFASIVLSPLCLCGLPYFLDCSKAVKHQCPICKAYLGQCE